MRSSIYSPVVLSLFLAACMPKHDGGNSSAAAPDFKLPASTKGAAQAQLLAQAQDCESTLRARLKHFDLKFENSDRSPIAANLANLNAEIAATQFTKTEFSFSKQNGKIDSLGTRRTLDDGKRSFDESLSLSTADSSSAMKFVISRNWNVTTRTPLRQETVDENWKIDANCKPHLSGASTTVITRQGDTLTSQSSSTNLDGRAGADRNDSRKIAIPKGTVIEQEQKSGGDLKDIISKMSNYLNKPFYNIGGSGQSTLTKLVTTALEQHVSTTDPISGISFDATKLTAQVFYSGVGAIPVEILFDPTLELIETVSPELNAESWTIPESAWAKLRLPTAATIATRSFMLDPSLPAQTPVRMEVQTTIPLTYENLSAYWTKISETVNANDPGGWKHSYQFSPNLWLSTSDLNSTPLSHDIDKADSPDELKSSAMVEIQIPQVQAIVNRLKPMAPCVTRAEMANLILPEVQKVLTYDYGSLDDGSISTLKTSEIFARGKGVCQHFANVFAAIARGLGLPTKIVTGYLYSKDGPAGGHAWNEIETHPGFWRPIEPQFSSSDFTSYMYLPIGGGHTVESPEINSSDVSYFGEMVQLQFKIQFRSR